VARRTFLLEVYLPRTAPGGLATAAARARSVTEEMRLAEGVPVRFLRSIFLLNDETCFHVFEAETSGDVEAAGARAGIRADRVIEAINYESPHAGPQPRGHQ
jgi:hypothetical protein